ncbi:MAG: acyltransferase family protein [Melioribacteraceae bacterium]|nr:acyltransferase family protein [Melioribacteraceae bacterium]MCF8262874.1 acyltransferase family protein [Melioribacteraceae bacterium]MCF8430898.1 acyltransferase family protein [Melioribacteraceae bacterium]
MSKRVDFIDVAKGISILLIVLYHSSLKQYFPEFSEKMGLFRVPLFFFVTGVFFKYNLPPTKYLVKVSDILLKPYFITLLIFMFYTVIMGEYQSWHIRGILYGTGDLIPKPWNAMWYLTHLWAVYLSSYTLVRVTKIYGRPIYLKLLLVGFLILIGLLSIQFFWYLPVTIFGKEIILHGLPFSLDLIPLSLVFFLSGSFAKKRIIEFKPVHFWFVISIVIFYLIATNTGSRILFNLRIYIEPFFATIAAVAGIYSVLSISYYLSYSPRLSGMLKSIGVSSLFILIFHVLFIELFEAYFISQFFEGYNPYYYAIAFVLSVAFPMLLRVVFVKTKLLKMLYFPSFR